MNTARPFILRWTLAALALCSCVWGQDPRPAPRVIEILADHDSRFKMAGQQQSVITLKAGEPVTLRITAKKAKHANRDGAVHGFALLRAQDESPVPEWDFSLKPGVQEFSAIAPKEAGNYVVVCTVICSKEHEGMQMKVVVQP